MSTSDREQEDGYAGGGRMPMNRSIRITLTDEELLALYQIILDEDRDGALKFLDEHLRNDVKAVLEKEGH